MLSGQGRGHTSNKINFHMMDQRLPANNLLNWHLPVNSSVGLGLWLRLRLELRFVLGLVSNGKIKSGE